MNYFLGVDIGTTSVKAIAFNQEGNVICKHSSGYEMLHPQPNYSEQNADEIFDAVVLSMNEVVEKLQPEKPSFISFSAVMHCLIAIDEKGKPLTNCIIWADNRAAKIADQLRDSDEGKSIYHATGVPVHAMSPLCKILWLKENERKLFNASHKFIGIKEYVFYKLFNTYVIDTAIASATGLLDLESLQWERRILDKLSLSTSKLSEVVSIESLFYYKPKGEATSLLNVSEETPFVIGGSDGALANLGAGSVSYNSMSVTIGTSAAVRILSDKPATDKDMRIFCYHAMDDQYIIGGASNNGAVVIDWLKDTLLQTSESYETLFQSAENINVGADDLFFVPYILGERAPVWNSDARGVFFGLSVNHTKAHLIRAAIEGVTYNLYIIGKTVMETNPVKEIYAAGGFAQSPLWLQVLADVFNCKVLVSGTRENSALGAVIVGIKALKMPVTIHQHIISEHTPDAANHYKYQKYFQKFERLYQLFKDEFSRDEISTRIPVLKIV